MSVAARVAVFDISCSPAGSPANVIGDITRRHGLFLHSRGNAHDQVVDISHDLLDLGNLSRPCQRCRQLP